MKKKCKKCSKQKSVDDFYEHCAMKDGRLSFCKECVRIRIREKYFENHEESLNRERERSRRRLSDSKYRLYKKKYFESHREESRKRSREWGRSNRHKTRAHLQLKRAVLRGDVSRKPCEVCGEEMSEAHHTDYSRPLCVLWLCRKHHCEAHRKR